MFRVEPIKKRRCIKTKAKIGQ